MTPNQDWITEPGVISLWLETQLGLPPWLIFAVMIPIVTLLLLFLLREMGLAALFLFQGPENTGCCGARISFHFTTLVGILAVGAVWRLRVNWVAESLGPTRGSGLKEYLTGFIYALLASLILGLLLYLMQRIFRLALSRLRAWAEAAKGLRFQETVFLTPKRIQQWADLTLRILRMAILLGLSYVYVPLLPQLFPPDRSLCRHHHALRDRPHLPGGCGSDRIHPQAVHAGVDHPGDPVFPEVRPASPCRPWPRERSSWRDLIQTGETRPII